MLDGVVGHRGADLGPAELGQQRGAGLGARWLVEGAAQVADGSVGRSTLAGTSCGPGQRLHHPGVGSCVGGEQVRGEALGIAAVPLEQVRRGEVAPGAFRRRELLGDCGADDRVDELERSLGGEDAGRDQGVLGSSAGLFGELGDGVRVAGLGIGPEDGDGTGQRLHVRSEATEAAGDEADHRACPHERDVVVCHPLVEHVEQRADQERVAAGRRVEGLGELAAAASRHQVADGGDG